MPEYVTTGRIVLFPETDKKNDKCPDFKGWLEDTDGKKGDVISVWKRKTDDGRNYLSGETQKAPEKSDDVF